MSFSYPPPQSAATSQHQHQVASRRPSIPQSTSTNYHADSAITAYANYPSANSVSGPSNNMQSAVTSATTYVPDYYTQEFADHPAKDKISTLNNSSEDPEKRNCLYFLKWPFSRSRSSLFRISFCTLIFAIMAGIIFAGTVLIASKLSTAPSNSGTSKSFTSPLSGYPPASTPPPVKAEWLQSIDLNRAIALNIPVRTNKDVPVPPTSNTGKPNDIVGCVRRTQWAMTFEGGPNQLTSTLLDALREAGVKSTFFLVGSSVRDNPAIVQRMFSEGHELGIQTWSMSPYTTLTNEQIVAEIMWTAQSIKEVTGSVPLTLRPPFGDVDDRVRAVAAALGLSVVMWNRDTMDWQGTVGVDPQLVTNWVMGNFTQWIAEIQSPQRLLTTTAAIPRASPTTTFTLRTATLVQFERIQRRQQGPSPTNGVVSLSHDVFDVGAATGGRAAKMLKAAGIEVGPLYACRGLANWRVV